MYWHWISIWLKLKNAGVEKALLPHSIYCHPVRLNIAECGGGGYKVKSSSPLVSTYQWWCTHLLPAARPYTPHRCYCVNSPTSSYTQTGFQEWSSRLWDAQEPAPSCAKCEVTPCEVEIHINEDIWLQRTIGKEDHPSLNAIEVPNITGI